MKREIKIESTFSNLDKYMKKLEESLKWNKRDEQMSKRI